MLKSVCNYCPMTILHSSSHWVHNGHCMIVIVTMCVVVMMQFFMVLTCLIVKLMFWITSIALYCGRTFSVIKVTVCIPFYEVI